jgi:hypothetical protein
MRFPGVTIRRFTAVLGMIPGLLSIVGGSMLVLGLARRDAGADSLDGRGEGTWARECDSQTGWEQAAHKPRCDGEVDDPDLDAANHRPARLSNGEG